MLTMSYPCRTKLGRSAASGSRPNARKGCGFGRAELWENRDEGKVAGVCRKSILSNKAVPAPCDTAVLLRAVGLTKKAA